MNGLYLGCGKTNKVIITMMMMIKQNEMKEKKRKEKNLMEWNRIE